MPTITPTVFETTRSATTAKASAAIQPTTEAAPTPEAAPVDAAAPAEKKLSPQYAALARKETEIRKRDEAIKAREAAFKAREAEYEQKYVPKDKLAKDPLTAIYESGMTKDQLIELLLNGPKEVDPALTALEQKIEAKLQAQREEQAKAQAEQQAQSYERAVAEIRKQADLIVASNEDYATIKETDSTEAVVELIKQTYDAEGVLLSVEEAAKQVEDHLLEEALKMAGLTKVKAKLTPTEPINEKIIPNKKTQSLAEAHAKAPTNNTTTLTNAATAVPSKPRTAMNSRERAILAFKGQLS